MFRRQPAQIPEPEGGERGEALHPHEQALAPRPRPGEADLPTGVATRVPAGVGRRRTGAGVRAVLDALLIVPVPHRMDLAAGCVRADDEEWDRDAGRHQ